MGKGSSAFLQGTSLQVMRQEAATKVIQRHVAQEKYINPHKPGFRKKQYNYPWMEDGNQWSSTSAVPQLKLYTSIPCKCITGPIHKKCGSKTKRVNF